MKLDIYLCPFFKKILLYKKNKNKQYIKNSVNYKL